MTQIKLIFAIFGDLINLEVLSDMMKLSPTSFWQKGDLIPNRKNGLVRKETCWEYSIGFIQTQNFEDVSEQFIDLIKPSIDLLENYVKENYLQTKIDLVVEIVNGEKPSFVIGKSLMELVIRINGEIDIDLYILEE